MFLFRLVHGRYRSAQPSEHVLRILKSSAFDSAYLLFSPYGVLMFNPRSDYAYLVRERHSHSTLWFYERGRLVFISHVDASPLDRDFGAPVLRSTDAGYYSSGVVLPLIWFSRLDDTGKTPLVLVPASLVDVPHGTVLQLDDVKRLLALYDRTYYPLPGDAELLRGDGLEAVRFTMDGVSVEFIARQGGLGQTPFRELTDSIRSLERIFDDPGEFNKLSNISMILHAGSGGNPVRLGLLATKAKDANIDRLRRDYRPGSSIGHTWNRRGIGVYRHLDGSTGNIIWVSLSREWAGRSYSFSSVARTYQLYEHSPVVSCRYAIHLLARIKGSQLYCCPVWWDDWWFRHSFSIGDRTVTLGRNVHVELPFLTLGIYHMFLRTQRGLVLLRQIDRDCALHPILMMEGVKYNGALDR